MRYATLQEIQDSGCQWEQVGNSMRIWIPEIGRWWHVNPDNLGKRICVRSPPGPFMVPQGRFPWLREILLKDV